MASIYSNRFSSVWHKILGDIWGDQQAKEQPIWSQYLDEKSTIKKYFDDAELVDPGLWSQTEEGADIDLDDYGEGTITRYEPIKFAKRLIIPEELMEDAQYEDVYDAVRMLSRTCNLTQDYDAVGILNSAFDSTVTGADGQSLGSTTHPIRGGSSVSNMLSPALSPSNVALQTMLIAADKMVGTNGFISPVKITKYVGPTNFKFRFAEILKSEQKDDTNNNAINALKGMSPTTYVPVPYMASLTNWFGKTNAPRGLMFIWRRKPRFRKSNNFDNETETHTGSARWTKGYSNFRGALCVNL